jgi:hypothetical protein
MAGAALSLFTDFFTHETGPYYLTGPDEVINDAQLRNFESLATFFNAKKEVQGGSQIKDVILLDDPLTASTYLPGDSASVTNVQGATTLTANWRFVRVPITWNEQEVLLNEGGGESAMFQQYKKIKRFKYQQAYTSLFNKLERLMVATASNSSMESATGTDPYSIFAFITSDGLAPSGFTNVLGINPTTKAAWRNQNTTYTAATPFDTDNGIIAGFDTISQLVVFKRPPSQKEYFSDDEFRRLVIHTNREGRRDFMKAIRANNDITRAGPQDPAFGAPVFLNIPVVNVEGYDDQSAFSSGSPGYIFVNMNYMKLIFHRQKFLQVSDPMVFPDKPDTVVVWCDSYMNLVSTSRKRHGFLSAA